MAPLKVVKRVNANSLKLENMWFSYCNAYNNGDSAVSSQTVTIEAERN